MKSSSTSLNKRQLHLSTYFNNLQELDAWYTVHDALYGGADVDHLTVKKERFHNVLPLIQVESVVDNCPGPEQAGGLEERVLGPAGGELGAGDCHVTLN